MSEQFQAPETSQMLDGRVALVTGGSRGIGAAIAETLASAGAAVVINHIEPPERAAQVRDRIVAAGGTAVLLEADVTNTSYHSEMFATVEQHFGPADILVNNAAIEARKPALEISPKDWDSTLSVNLTAPYFLSLEFARRLIALGRRGTIINLSSIHEDAPMQNNSPYNISKSGLRMVTRSLALEFAPNGITVNSLIPGAIRTDLNRKVLADPAYETTVLSKIPLGWIAEPAELGAAAVFLASSQARYITGTSLKLDGGMSL